MATKKYLDLDGLSTFKNKMINEIPTKTSDLTNDSGFIADSKVVVINYGDDIKYSTVLNYLHNGYSVFCKCYIDFDMHFVNDFQYIPAVWESNDYDIITFSCMTSNEDGETVFRNIVLEYQEENGVETYGYWYDNDEHFQEKLIPGTNIKTINNQSILGSGNISISGGLTIDDIYPVGSIYMSVNSTNPATLFGGTWQRIKDTFLLASGDTYANGTTGGSATHTLTIDEMPSHTHIQNAHNHKWLGRKATWGSSGGNNVLIDNTGSSYSAVSAVANNGIDETTATNQNTGGGQAHNNMPPYLAVYMWQRTA